MPSSHPVEASESDGVAVAFVKSFKRDYVRVSPIPSAQSALAANAQASDAAFHAIGLSTLRTKRE